eukprot:6696068-Pyramimonas_sp.AAC.1
MEKHRKLTQRDTRLRTADGPVGSGRPLPWTVEGKEVARAPPWTTEGREAAWTGASGSDASWRAWQSWGAW